MAKAAKSRPRVGDTAWCVEWCYELTPDGHGGVDMDACKNRTRTVATREEAEKLAREVYPEDKFGNVMFWPVEFVAYDDEDAGRYPHIGHWQASDEVEYYSGEDAP